MDGEKIFIFHCPALACDYWIHLETGAKAPSLPIQTPAGRVSSAVLQLRMMKHILIDSKNVAQVVQLKMKPRKHRLTSLTRARALPGKAPR